MPTSTLVPLESHALATLRYIRATIDAAAYVAVPGSAGLAVGAVGIVVAVLAGSAPLHAYWLQLYLAAAVLAAGAGSILVARQGARNGFALRGTPVRKVLAGLLPSLVAGGALTLMHLRLGNAHAVPATWLLLYGCALVSVSALTSRTLGVLGALFMLLGCVAFVLPDRYEVLVLGLGFGGLHVLYGLVAGGRQHVLAR
jgi:hypothetical protein